MSGVDVVEPDWWIGDYVFPPLPAPESADSDLVEASA